MQEASNSECNNYYIGNSKVWKTTWPIKMQYLYSENLDLKQTNHLANENGKPKGKAISPPTKSQSECKHSGLK